ncbi:hypothetical protein Pan97_47230 [Bremerella volcania]|uniref:Uncharacterized protein n=1 Tax=Bremerella volcania TaxID=2527984 RepID=A0A518CEM2_9BACT|nr:hypothetical protein [Bremerella volcania]QDU77651.1 hypothetical protein Pan97_47230 [Bremerella volcania]
MSTTHHLPKANGAFSRENKPQVVVRAGKHYVCSSCGTMVEIPADVVGQLVIAIDPAPKVEEPQQQPSTPVSKNADVSIGNSDDAAVERRSTLFAPAKPVAKRPKQKRFVGEMIDGLKVPSAGRLDRALAWVTFHLKVLDRQGSEIKRLKKLLKKESVPCPRPHGHAMKVAGHESRRPCRQEQASHAHEDVGMSPNTDPAKERGPPA